MFSFQGEVGMPGCHRSITSWGRYINHSFPPKANVKMVAPIHIGNKWRVGFISTRQIMEGEELLYDYGQQSNGPDWLKKKKPATICDAWSDVSYND